MIEVVLIAACSLNRAIGYQGKLPWPHMAADMRRFRQMTLGEAIVMGRKTFESMGSKALPERYNLVVSRTITGDQFSALVDQQVYAFGSLLVALEMAELEGYERVFVIGGGEIYQAALPLASRIELTVIDTFCPGDAFFPELPDGWLERSVDRHPADDKNPHAYTFKTYVRI